MLVNIIILILGAGLFSVIIPEDKLSRLWSLLAIGAISYVFYQVYLWNGTAELKEIYPWVRTQNVRIDLEIILNNNNQYFISTLLFFSLLVILQNSVYQAENSKKFFNGIVLLNIFFIMMLISSSNYMQFLTAIGMIDVLVFSAINNTDAKKSFIYANFLADMGILSICAVILGQSGNIDLSYLTDYVKFGQHKDYVAIILLICIFIKSGLFMFQGSLLELSSLSFNRLNFIIYGTTPLVGFLVLKKLQPLLNISEYSYPILQIFSFASIIWGFMGTIAIDNLKQKAVYFALMFWGLLYAFIALDKQLPSHNLPALMLSAYLFGQTLMLINFASSNEKYVSEMGGFIKSLKLTGLITLIILTIYINFIWMAYSHAGWICPVFIVLLVVSTSHLMGQIYLGESHADERVVAMLKNPSIILWLPILAASVFTAYNLQSAWIYTAVTMLIWLLLFVFRPLRRLETLYNQEIVQDLDLFASAYELVIVTPLRVIGRVLWLAVDFVFFERTIINSITNLINFFIRIFQKIHTDNFYSYVLFTLLGFCIVYLIWWFGGR